MKRLLNHMKKQIKTTVWKYYALSFLRSFALFAGVLVPFFTQWGGLSLFEIQLLQAWFVLWVFLLEVPSGAVADRLGRKVSVALGLMCSATAIGLYGVFTGIAAYLFIEAFMALGVALASGADQALLYDSLKESGREEESKNIIGKAHAYMLAGMALAAPLGGLLAGIYGLQVPVYLSAVPIFLAGIIALTIPEPKIGRRVAESKRYVDIVRKGFKFFYTHKTLRILAIDAILVASAGYFVIWLYQPMLEKVGVPLFYFGFIHAALVVTEILIAANFTRLERWFGSPKRLLRATALFTAVGFLLAALMPNTITVLLFVILAGGFGLTRMELMFAYMHKFIPSEQRATVLSSISMFRRFALVPLNPFVGFVAGASLQLALVCVAVLPLLVFLFSPIEEEMVE